MLTTSLVMLALAESHGVPVSPSGAQELPPGFGRGGVQILRHRVPERHAHEANPGMALGSGASRPRNAGEPRIGMMNQGGQSYGIGMSIS